MARIAKAGIMKVKRGTAGKSSNRRLLDRSLVSKTADDKGRVVLGRRFANRAVIVEQLSETEVVVKLARVIPESEAWLYENAAALGSVRRGLAQARGGEVAEGPDVDADADVAAELEG
jgi:hypothetical protein